MKYLLVLMVILAGFHSSAQSRKEIKSKKLKSMTVWQLDADNSGKYKDSEEEYNKEGQLISKIDYEKDGSIRKKETAVYDDFGNKTAETYYCPKEAKNEKITWKYNIVNAKTEETVYNGSGKVIKRSTYTYNANGDKLSENVYDGAGILVKKMTYTYNNRKLKETRLVYNASNKLESTRTYSYEYY